MNGKKLIQFFKGKAWRVALFGLLLVMIGVVGVIISIIFEVRFKVSEMKLVPTRFEASNSSLEMGSFVRREDFKHFLNFMMKEEKATSLIENLLSTEAIQEEAGGLYSVHKEIKIGALYANHCQDYRCLQHLANFTDLPPALWRGLMGIEDIRFLEHKGVDPISIMRAIWVDIKSMSLAQGGSTLTQQLVKNIFLTSDKSFMRKIKEVVYAVYLEQILEKEEIITWYFNEVFWGSLQGVKLRGITMASIAYFDNEPKFLSEYEISILISLLKGPYFYSPLNHPDRLRERADVVFNKLIELNLIVGDESDRWTDKNWERFKKNIKDKQSKTYLRNIDYMTKNSDALLSLYEKFVMLEATSRMMKGVEERTKEQDVALKVFIMDNQCEDSSCEKFFGHYSKQQRNQKKALFEEKHQVGSVLKPFAYEVFLREGKEWEDMVETRPITLNLKSGKWTPKEASRNALEEISVKESLELSRNIPLIRMADEIGFDKLEVFLKRYFEEDLKTPLKEYPSQLLGAIELSVSELTGSYIRFFKDICHNVDAEEYSFEETVPYQLTFHERTTIRNVASKRLKAFHFFGKTGTSNNGNDNWFVANDGQRFYTFWFGRETGRANEAVRLSGAVTSFRVFEDFFLYRGKRVSDFECAN